MSRHLQQLDSGFQAPASMALAAVNRVSLIANSALLVVLVIIPTISGVALIA